MAVYIEVVGVRPTCGWSIATVRVWSTASWDPNPIYVEYTSANSKAALGIIRPLGDGTFSVGRPPGESGQFVASYPGIFSKTAGVVFPLGLLPRLSLDGIRYTEAPCLGTVGRIVASVRETGGECEAKFHLEYDSARTKTEILPPMGSTEVPIEFIVPGNPVDIVVELIDDITGKIVGTRIASINPRIPNVEVGDFDIPQLGLSPSACPGVKLVGSVPIRVIGCAQELRGGVVDEVSGNVLSSFGPSIYEPGKDIKLDFSFTMPYRAIPLRALVEKQGEVWKTIGVSTREIGCRVPATAEITGTEVQRFGRPGFMLSGSVIAENLGECAGDIGVEGFLEGRSVMRDTHLLPPGASKTSTFSVVMPALPLAHMGFEATSPREGGREVTSRAMESVRSAWAVMLDEGILRIIGGDKPNRYIGLMVADEVPKLLGPKMVAETERTLLDPLPKRKKICIFAGSVDPFTEESVFHSGLSYLRMNLGEKASWCQYGVVKKPDTNAIEYGRPIIGRSTIFPHPVLETLLSGVIRSKIPEEMTRHFLKQ